MGSLSLTVLILISSNFVLVHKYLMIIFDLFHKNLFTGSFQHNHLNFNLKAEL